MSDFIDADCVISSLFEQKLLTQKTWKLPKASKSYNVFFEFANTPKTIGFQIYIKDAFHYIEISALINQCRRFKFPVTDILKNCAVV